MRKYGKGSITIWLSLILCVILSLIFACIQSARLSAARAFVSICMDESLFSEFARYDRILYEKYGLLAVDGGFGGGTLDFASVVKEIDDAAKEVMSAGEDLFRLSLTRTDVTGYVLATDSNGASIRSQIADLMNRKLGIDGVNRLIGMVNTNRPIMQHQEANPVADPEQLMELYEEQKSEAAVRKSGLSDPEIINKAAAVTISGIDPDGVRETGGTGDDSQPSLPSVPEDFVNPLDNFEAIMKMGLYNIILPDPAKLSNRAIDRSALPENRTLQEGMGLLPEQSGNPWEHFLMAAYVTDFFPDFCSGSEQEGIRYQAEFAIAGKGSDADNLKSVLNRILLIRMGLNYLYLQFSPVKKAEAEGIALIISVALMNPGAVEVITQVLLLAWAYGESMLDLKTLLAGGKEPLIKDDSSWQLSLEGLASLSADTPTDNSLLGLSYEDHLIVLLCMLSEEELTNRILDLLEYNRRIKGSDPAFQIDSCFTALETETFGAIGDYEFSIRRGYGYDLYPSGS